VIDAGMPAVLALWQAAAACVLLIGCANVASLLLARGVERRQELAVRLALGAGRRQLVRQMLVEPLVPALAAAPLALGVAWAVTRWLQASMPAALVRYVPGWTSLRLDGRILAFTIGGSLAASLIFGLLPALSASRVLPTAALGDGSRSATAGRTRGRLRRGLVVAQIALALPLLVASGLTAMTAQGFAGGPQGFNPDGSYQLRLRLAASTHPDGAARRLFADRLLDEAAAVPGVTSAAITTVLPSSTESQGRVIAIDGLPDDPNAPRLVSLRAVSPACLETMQIPLRSGRHLVEADRDDRERVSIVSESFVRRYLADGSPIGRRIRIGRSGDTWTTVVGVTGDTIDDWFFARGVPTIFVPLAQFPSADFTLVARTPGPPEQLADGLRRALAAVDPAQPAYGEMTVRDVVRTRTTGLRFVAALMAAFGGLALVLSAIGIYGIMSHVLAVRRRELGVRMALGASSRDVLGLAIGQGVRLTLLGIVLGLAGAVALGRLIEGALFGIVALDGPLVLAIALLLGAVAVLAAVIPARRAMRLDPALVLRD
jgi:predicted permease